MNDAKDGYFRIECGKKNLWQSGEFEIRPFLVGHRAEMIRAKEPGDKIVLYTGLGKEDVNKLAGSLNTILVWNTVIE